MAEEKGLDWSAGETLLLTSCGPALPEEGRDSGAGLDVLLSMISGAAGLLWGPQGGVKLQADSTNSSPVHKTPIGMPRECFTHVLIGCWCTSLICHWGTWDPQSIF